MCKKLILEQPSTVNMIKGVKHCWNVWNTAETCLLNMPVKHAKHFWNVRHSTFIKFFYYSKKNIEL